MKTNVGQSSQCCVERLRLNVNISVSKNKMNAGTLLFSFVVILIVIETEGNENIYANAVQNAVSLKRNVNRSPSGSVKDEAFTEMERIKNIKFADFFHSERNGRLLSNVAAGYNISEECIKHIELTAEYFVNGTQWALQMIDAFGKPGAGAADGNVRWYGSFDECLKVKADVSKNNRTEHAFDGQYCYLAIPLSQSKINPLAIIEGLCVPDTCSTIDLNILVYEVLALLPQENTTIAAFVQCVSPTLELDTKAIVAITILCVLGAFMLLGTGYDIIYLQWPQYRPSYTSTQEADPLTLSENSPLIDNKKTDIIKPEPNMAGKLLLSFSVYTNGSKILSTKQGAGSISCVHGIRFLSMSWVLLGHTFLMINFASSNSFTFSQDLYHRWSFQAIENAMVSVDTFFTLSGLLVSYLTLRELQKKAGKINWVMFYFHRFWRLTPAYMLVLMVDVCLYRYFGNGPIWPPNGTEINYCKDTWWKNLLYINNLFPSADMCMSWSWYLSNDMQFYVLSPLMIIPLYWSGIVGLVVCFVFLLATIVTAGAISSHFELPALLFDEQAMSGTYMDAYYMKPYCRIGPYVIGILTGYVLYKTNCRIKLNKYINLMCWLLATFFALIILYGLYDPDQAHPLSVPVSALYNATHRTVWGMCVCWVIFACATGNGGFVNTLLSWSPFVALGRLTYCSYLIHILVIMQSVLTIRTSLYLTDGVMIYTFLSLLVMTNLVAFVSSLTFEAPMMGLEKVVFRREKSS